MFERRLALQETQAMQESGQSYGRWCSPSLFTIVGVSSWEYDWSGEYIYIFLNYQIYQIFTIYVPAVSRPSAELDMQLLLLAINIIIFSAEKVNGRFAVYSWVILALQTHYHCNVEFSRLIPGWPPYWWFTNPTDRHDWVEGVTLSGGSDLEWKEWPCEMYCTLP